MHWGGTGLRSSWRPGPTGVRLVYLLFLDCYRGMVNWPLFRNDFDEDAVRENSATEQVNASVPGKAAEHGRDGIS